MSSQPQPTPNRRTPLNIVPVSYSVKPTKPEKAPAEEEFLSEDWDVPRRQQPPQEESAPKPDDINDVRAWSREDIRFVKDAPSLTPVSYSSRVAPLPEDRVEVKEDREVKEQLESNEELDRERSKIEAGNLDPMRRMLMAEGEKVPFPTLVRPENSKGKVVYDLKEAIQLVKAKAKRNFEETFEAHVKLTPELRRTDLKLSGSVLLPHGSGKKFRVAVFAEGNAAEEAREAGATEVGGLDFIEQIKNGKKFDFDKCFATHEMMKHVLKIAKRLKRGMMPNPENGTVTNDIGRAVKTAVSQTVFFQKDKTAIVHVPLGKVTYSEDALRENIGAFTNALLLAKPAGLKKSSKFAGYVSTFHVCSSMGPSFPVTVQSLSLAVDRYNRLRLQA